ncbi:hypothetical protein PspLS_11425 [Pyricularia sp. CBS 133598]|nr:hypothetical protein PspLS_11425 [Pyricularia sp. CBS 133598]
MFMPKKYTNLRNTNPKPDEATPTISRPPKLAQISSSTPSVLSLVALELAERRNAKTSLSRLSEAADVAFSISRARFDGHALRISVLDMMKPACCCTWWQSLAYGGFFIASLRLRAVPGVGGWELLGRLSTQEE